MIRVSAGIIRRPNGDVLLCRRGEGRMNAHLWEFPGGKQQDGESPADCLRRELLQELSLPVENIRQVWSSQAQNIHFDFLTCTTDREPVLTEHEAMVWTPVSAMGDYDYCPADTLMAWRIVLSGVTACIWDFDGTLADTYPMMRRVMREAAQLQGADPSSETVAQLLSHDSKICAATLARDFGVDPVQLLKDFHRLQNECRDCGLMPGIEDVLRQTRQRGMRHYLLTNRGRHTLDFLRRCGIDELFDGWLLGDEGYPQKPDPSGMAALLQRNGLDAAHCLMIGDRLLDLTVGRANGVPGLLFSPYPGCEGRPCMEAADAEELAALLQDVPGNMIL